MLSRLLVVILLGFLSPVHCWASAKTAFSIFPRLTGTGGLYVAQRGSKVVCAAKSKTKGGSTGVETNVERIKSAGFIKEIEDAGMQCEMLSLANFGRLRGVMAKVPIRSGATMLSYPRSAVMDLASLTSCPCPELIDDGYWKAAPWYQQLGLWLVAEQAKGCASKWANYIALLPDSIPTPAHWTEEQLDKLCYPPIKLAVAEQRLHFEALTDSARQHLAAGASPNALDKLEWAMEVVLSRALDTVELRTQDEGLFGKIAASISRLTASPSGTSGRRAAKALVPMLDFVNHATRAAPRFGYDAKSDRFSVTAERAYGKGEQVLISYGEKSNDDLLILYGFIEEDNPADVYQLSGLAQWLVDSCSHPRLAPSAAARRARLSALADMGVADGLTDARVSRADKTFSPRLLQALRVFLATSEEMQQEAEKGGGSGFVGTVSRENEEAVGAVLKAYCVQLLSEKIEKVEAGRGETGGEEGGERARERERERERVEESILRFRLAKRKVLKELFYKGLFH